MSVTTIERPVVTETFILPHPMTISDGIGQDNGLRFNFMASATKHGSACALVNLFVSSFGMEESEGKFLRAKEVSMYTMLTDRYSVLSTMSYKRPSSIGSLLRSNPHKNCRCLKNPYYEYTLIDYIEHIAAQSRSFQEVADKVREMGY